MLTGAISQSERVSPSDHPAVNTTEALPEICSDCEREELVVTESKCGES